MSFRIARVATHEFEDAGLRFRLDRPKPGDGGEGAHSCEFSGWAASKAETPDRVRLRFHGFEVQRRVDFGPRPDVMSHLRALWPGAPKGGGFHMRINPAAFLASELDLHVDVVSQGGAHLAATVSLEDIDHPRFPAVEWSPLYLNPQFGRTGGTVMMRLLSAHPEIVADDDMPYEAEISGYYARSFFVHAQCAPEGVELEREVMATNETMHVGRPLFFRLGSSYASWFEKEGLELLGAQARDCIAGYYDYVARRQGKGSRTFVEKAHTNTLYGRLTRAFFGGRIRSVYVVRDLRDMFCSINAFNRKRGRLDFRREPGQTDEEYLRFLGHRARGFLHAMDAGAAAGSSICVAYEDLMRAPHETMTRVFAELGFGAEPSLVDEIVEKAFRADGGVRNHMTAGTALASVGRWQTELDASLAAIAEEEFGDVLARVEAIRHSVRG